MDSINQLPSKFDRLIMPASHFVARKLPNIHPNWYTIARIVLVIPIALMLVNGCWPTALILFIIAAALDIFDGAVARLQKKTSLLGAYLDPLADKLLFIAVILVFNLLVWPIILIGIIVLEVILLIEHTAKYWQLKISPSKQNIHRQSSSLWGKCKFWAEICSLLLLFFSQYRPELVIFANIILTVALILALNSLVVHLKNSSLLNKRTLN